jgi:ribonuclease Y
VDLARKYHESADVVHAIAAHHEDEPFRTVEAVLVYAADSISAARPGARRESLEGYIKRLDRLEKIAESCAGVERSFAIQAGREVRILVKPDEVDDVMAIALAKEIANKIQESDLEYPGQIKVTVIRETRSSITPGRGAPTPHPGLRDGQFDCDAPSPSVGRGEGVVGERDVSGRRAERADKGH